MDVVIVWNEIIVWLNYAQFIVLHCVLARFSSIRKLKKEMPIVSLDMKTFPHFV